MEHLSPHGIAFVALQVLIVIALHWGLVRWHRGPGHEPTPIPHQEADRSGRKRSAHALPLVVGLGFVVWTLVLRIQPARQGGDPFAYTLGIFDGVSGTGIATLVLVHVLLSRRRHTTLREAADR